jgi:hypothetical protein
MGQIGAVKTGVLSIQPELRQLNFHQADPQTRAVDGQARTGLLTVGGRDHSIQILAGPGEP